VHFSQCRRWSLAARHLPNIFIRTAGAALLKNPAQIYAEAYRTHGRSPASLLIPKGRQKDRFTALTAPFRDEAFSVLDYGCGFGDLKFFLDERFHGVRYTGVDVTPEFITECKRIHGEETDFRLISDHRELRDDFDYVVMSGVFNVLCHDTDEEHWSSVQGVLRYLFLRTRRLLAVDFMTNQVDFVRSGAYHQDPIEAYRFVRRELSKRVTLDQSYMPYEFALLVYKNDTIQRPQNVYNID
jgi:SAM-dependent methyltransferase